MENNTSRTSRVRQILSNTSALIESTLLLDYGVPREEALQLEEELFSWFDRLTRRPGTSESALTLRASLLSMTCKVGHVYWTGRLAEEQTRDERVRRSLALGPEIIAIELERRLEASERQGDA